MMWTVMTSGLCSSSLSRCTCPTHTWCPCLISNEITSYYRCNEGHHERPPPPPPAAAAPTPLFSQHDSVQHTRPQLGGDMHSLARWFATFGRCAINWILGFSCRILRWSVLCLSLGGFKLPHASGKENDLKWTTLLLFLI